MSHLTFEPTEDHLGAISTRSILLGTLACVLVSVMMPLSEFLVGASRMNLSQLPVGVTGLFVLTIFANVVVGRMKRTLALTPGEIVVIFVMGFIASIVTTSNLLNWPMGIMAAPYYFATPENRWIEDVWPYLRQWAVVQGPREELRWAFVGMPSGESIPWGIWFTPMYWWGSFVGAVGFGSICLAAMLRKQWAEHERLAFPLVQVPLDIMSDPGGRWNLPAMMHRRAFRVGASIPLVVILWNCVHYFQPTWPRIPLMDGTSIQLGKEFPELALRINWYVLGFAYVVNTNVLLSVWLWNVVVIVESGICNVVGFSLGARDDPYSSRDALTSWQGFGGFIVFVLVSMWMARHHLRHVFLSALNRVEADDERELLPYRWAVIGLVASVVYMACFLHSLGMSWLMVLVFLFGAFVAYLGTTRVVAQTGLVYMQSPLTPTMFAFGSFGTVGVPAAEIIGMVGTYSLVVNGRAPLMPGIFHISWLGGKIGRPGPGRSGRRMFVVVAVGLVTAYLFGAAYYLYIAYTHGTSTFLSTHFGFHGHQVWDNIIGKMQARKAVDLGRWGALGIGALVMSVLTLLQYRFPGWPIHPVGFPIAAANNVHRIMFTFFVAWLIKTILLRIGGVDAYERARPAFLGIVAGYALGVLISFLVDWTWFPGAGHRIHSW